MNQAAGDLLQDRLRAVRIKFIEILDERRSDLEHLRAQIELQDDCTNALRETQFIAHKIAGTASILGFPEFGQIASDTEETIIQHLSGTDYSPTIDETKQVIDQLLVSAAKIG